jgi:hypothetical protein
MLRYTFFSPNFKLLLHKKEIKTIHSNQQQICAHHLIEIVFSANRQ